MKFMMLNTKVKLKEETLDYMAEMMENAKWNGTIVFNDHENGRNSYNAARNEISLNPKKLIEKANAYEREPEMQLLSTFAHELYHAIDPSKENQGVKEIKLVETIYEERNYKSINDIEKHYEEINGLKKEAVDEMVIAETRTNNAIDLLPKSHPDFQKLQQTFLEINIAANETYINSGAEFKISQVANRVLEDKNKGVPLEKQEDYLELKTWQKGIKENSKRAFNEWNFHHKKDIFIKNEIEKGTVVERMEPKAKIKEQTFEKEIKVKMVKEELQLSKTTSLTKEEVTISRAYVLATEEVKEKTKSSIKEKAVEVFKSIQSGFKKLKEKVTSKEKTNEHTL